MLININDELFTSALTNCKITSSSCVTLLKDGLIQYESEELYGNNTLEKLSNKDLRIIQDKSQNVSFGETIYYEISENYVIFQPLSLENLGILAIIPKTEMYFDYQNFSVASIRFSIVVISLCIVLYLIVTYIFSKPLNSLVTQLDYVSVNQFDIRVHANGGKEISNKSI